jgi:hypothetical protein
VSGEEEKEIQFVEVAGKQIPAQNLVCPSCRTLWLDVTVNTSVTPWVATCPNNPDHTWEVPTQVN